MKRKLIPIAAIGASFLVLLVVSLFVWTRPPPSTPLPNPNGYDDFIKAGVSLGSRDFSDLSNAGLVTAVTANAEALRLVRLGLTRKCRMPMEKYSGEYFTGAALQRFSSFKRVAQFLAANARLAEQEGRTNDAIASCVDTIKFGNEISRGGFIIDRLVGIACEAIGCSPLARLAAALTPEQSRHLVSELENIGARQVAWTETWRNEKSFIRQSFRQHPNPLIIVPELWQLRTSAKRSEARDQKISARLRLLTVELALHCYQQEKGQLPARLEGLLPEYLKAIPQDPFSGKPLAYRPQGTNWLLYSVGPDGVDDGGGRPVSKGNPSGTDQSYDSP